MLSDSFASLSRLTETGSAVRLANSGQGQGQGLLQRLFGGITNMFTGGEGDPAQFGQGGGEASTDPNRPLLGDVVKVIEGGEASYIGKEATVIQDDRDAQPYRLQFGDGALSAVFYRERQVSLVRRGERPVLGETVEVLTDIGGRKGQEALIVQDDRDAQPYRLKFSDGSLSDVFYREAVRLSATAKEARKAKAAADAEAAGVAIASASAEPEGAAAAGADAAAAPADSAAVVAAEVAAEREAVQQQTQTRAATQEAALQQRAAAAGAAAVARSAPPAEATPTRPPEGWTPPEGCSWCLAPPPPPPHVQLVPADGTPRPTCRVPPASRARTLAAAIEARPDATMGAEIFADFGASSAQCGAAIPPAWCCGPRPPEVEEEVVAAEDAAAAAAAAARRRGLLQPRREGPPAP